MTPTSASDVALKGRVGQIRPPARSSGSCDRTATTRTGRSAAKPRRRSARALAASSLSALIASSTRAVVGGYVLAGELARPDGDHERAFPAYQRAMAEHVRGSRAVALSAAKTPRPASAYRGWSRAPA
jgi:hypothetical protein